MEKKNMREIKLLIVDDDSNVLESFAGSVERFNRDNDDKFKLYVAENLEQASNYIQYYKLDTAIIDLNLENGSGLNNDDGNVAIHDLVSFFRIPIFILTGEPEKLKQEYRNKKNIQCFTRGSLTNADLLTKIRDEFLLKTIQYFSREGYLEKKINKFYWENLQETIDSWKEVAEHHPDEINKILSRHTVASLNEELYVDGNIGSFDHYHPGEMYIIPPIKQHYHTGDILKKESELYVILNPACDIVNKNKLSYYTLAKIIRAVEIFEISSKDSAGRETYIASHLRSNNKVDRYHYLPKFATIDNEYVIDFQNLLVESIGPDTNPGNATYIKDREALIGRYQKIASISSPFLKDVIARFSLYYARQGQPKLL